MPKTDVPGRNVFERTMPMLFEKHSFGDHRKVSLAHVQVKKTADDQQDPDSKLLTFGKRLFDFPKMRAITRHDDDFRQYLWQQAAIPFRPGLVLVPVGLIDAVARRAEEWVTGRDRLADEATLEYPAVVEAMRGPLGPLYNPRDYPPAPVFRAAWWAQYRFVDMGVPNMLKEFKADVFARERAKLEREAQRAVTTIQQHLRETLLDITVHLERLLTAKGDGRFPALRENALDGLNAFLSTLELRDVTNDAQLRDVVRRLRAAGAGIPTREALKDDQVLRARVGAAVTEIKATLETLVVDRPRQLRVREDEEGVA